MKSRKNSLKSRDNKYWEIPSREIPGFSKIPVLKFLIPLWPGHVQRQPGELFEGSRIFPRSLRSGTFLEIPKYNYNCVDFSFEVVDEPLAAQSDPSLLDLQLRAVTRFLCRVCLFGLYCKVLVIVQWERILFSTRQGMQDQLKILKIPLQTQRWQSCPSQKGCWWRCCWQGG